MLRPNGSTSGACAGEKPWKSIPVSLAGGRQNVPPAFRNTSSLSEYALSMPFGSRESDPAVTTPSIEGSAMSWPTEIRLPKDRKALAVSFDDGERFLLPAEYLRVKSPSAEVQGHSPHERKTVPGKRYVEILEVQPVGNYAVRLTFDDMHSTGIYSWDYLHELGSNQPRYWQEYLDELAAQRLSREPSGRRG